MPAFKRFPSLRRFSLLAVIAAAALFAAQPARSEALIVVEAGSGRVLYQENATYPWYPASVTKLMTMYVALKAVKEGRIRLDTLLTVSPAAASQVPSKMGFPPGTTVTLENALAMMMVKSANDIAVVVAEGVAGSIDKFAYEMNLTAQRLGMTQTHYVNPNGLPDDGQVTSARDMAMLARAIMRDLPEYEYFAQIPAIKFGRRVTRNFNSLIGRYPGADGMKTGFICASGFNLVATATRNGKRMIAVVLGAPSSPVRAAKAAQLLERGFNRTSGLSWLTPSLGTLASMQPVTAEPPNLREDMCGPKRKRPGIQSDDDHVAIATGNTGTSENGDNSTSLFSAHAANGSLKPSEMLALPAAPVEPMVVYTGPKRTGADLVAAVAADEAKQTPRGKGKKKKSVTVRASKNADAKDATSKDATSKDASSKDAKSKDAKSRDAKAEAKSATKPTKPKQAAKGSAEPKAAAKPAPAKDAKSTTAKPAAPKAKSAAKDSKN